MCGWAKAIVCGARLRVGRISGCEFCHGEGVGVPLSSPYMGSTPTTIETTTRIGRVTRSVLVVDDDPNIREMLAIHLRNAGYVVRTAKDGIEGGYSVLSDRPDLVISDVQMPHMDGFDFVAALRADRSVSDIPVIMLTSEVEWEERGKRLGANDYVTKPVRADRLLSLVAEQLDAKDRQRVA